jgi:subtilisin family serine protease
VRRIVIAGVCLVGLISSPFTVEAGEQAVGSASMVQYASDVAVKFPSLLDTSTINSFAKSRGLREVEYLPQIGWHRFAIEDGKSPVNKADELINNVMIEDAEAIPLGTIAAFPNTPPNDPKYPTSTCPCWGYQWNLPNTGFPQAWQIAGGGNSTKAIGILDTGVDRNHPDLGYIGGRSFVPGAPDRDDVCRGVANHPFGHGTAVAGVAAAFTNNGNAAAGVAYNAQIWSLKISADCVSWDFGWAASGITWAVDSGSVWVINASIEAPELDSAKVDLLRDAVDYAWAHNVPVVAPTGNAGNFSFQGVFPVYFAHTIKVGGTELKSDGVSRRWSECIGDEYCGGASGANYGSPGLDVAAPADKLVLHKPGGGTYFAETSGPPSKGTSFAAPLVSGIVFLIRSRHPTWTSDQIRTRLRDTADKRGGYNYQWNTSLCGGQSSELGCGVVDADAAVQ